MKSGAGGSTCPKIADYLNDYCPHDGIKIAKISIRRARVLLVHHLTSQLRSGKRRMKPLVFQVLRVIFSAVIEWVF